ncbi:MAG: hypothetical protein ACYC42_06790 [Lysobacter sp.]
MTCYEWMAAEHTCAKCGWRGVGSGAQLGEMFRDGYVRFGKVVAILRAKYGTALRDLVPTPGSELDLYGDALASSRHVDRVRAALLRRRYRLRPRRSAPWARSPCR